MSNNFIKNPQNYIVIIHKKPKYEEIFNDSPPEDFPYPEFDKELIKNGAGIRDIAKYCVSFCKKEGTGVGEKYPPFAQIQADKVIVSGNSVDMFDIHWCSDNVVDNPLFEFCEYNTTFKEEDLYNCEQYISFYCTSMTVNVELD